MYGQGLQSWVRDDWGTCVDIYYPHHNKYSNLYIMHIFYTGILQGGIYGNCNIFFARQLGISKTADYKGLFRGALFAPPRDMISQVSTHMTIIISLKTCICISSLYNI
jgi:hypothetical protein